MEATFADFTRAQEKGDGYLLASTITPSAPVDQPSQLLEFVQSSNVHQIQTDVRYGTVYNNAISLTKAEAKAWQEIFVAFWNTASEIVFPTSGGKREDEQWSRVYDAWKDVVNALIRGYTSSGFPAWTVPCLYVAGKYLRIFAIKADEQAARAKGSVTFNAGFQDDVVESVSKNEKLEDAARQINRIFSICIGDRYDTDTMCFSAGS